MQYMCRKFADVQQLLNIAHNKYKDELYVENKLSVNNYLIKTMNKYSKEKMGFYRIPESLEKVKVLSRLGSEIDVNALYIIQDDEAVKLGDKKFKRNWRNFFYELSKEYNQKISAAIYLDEETFHNKLNESLEIYKEKLEVYNGK